MSYYGLILGSVALVAFIVFIACFGLIGYLFKAIAFYSMAKGQEIDHAWLAWIPVVNNYLFGELIDNKVRFTSLVIPQAKWILLFAPIAVSVLTPVQNGGVLSLIVAILGILVAIYQYSASYRLYKLYDPDKAVVYTVISAIFFWIVFLPPIFYFTLRNKTKVEYEAE